jgi:orotidine-5'-phosphate decarboxylase
MKRNPIIVALDVDSAAEARMLVSRLAEHIRFYKVGMELYAAAGMPFVRELLAGGNDVFLDMKFYDIPETVKRAVAQVAGTGVRFLTLPLWWLCVRGRPGKRVWTAWSPRRSTPLRCAPSPARMPSW